MISLRSNLLTAATVLLMTSFIPTDASATPASAWRTGPTGLESVSKCTRRAYDALETAGLKPKDSGDSGAYGSDGIVGVYVLCEKVGARAVIFCVSDATKQSDYMTKKCDSVNRNMKP